MVMVLLLDFVRVPRELFLNELLSLFRYPPESGRALLTGTLPLRYCAARFAYSTPTWRLPVSGHVVDLVAAHSDSAGDLGDEVVGLRVFRGTGLLGIRTLGLVVFLVWSC